jgi:hypothetical protein
MNLEIVVRLSSGRYDRPKLRGAMVMPDDFIQQMRDALQKQQSQSQLSAQTQLHYAKVLETEGPKRWRELKAWLSLVS